jgi:NADP-dependent 3-hydroxy acid dehydrogenase YdfG
LGPTSSAHGIEVRVAEVDVRHRDVVAAEAAALLETGWVPDILLNNAGLAAGLATVQEGDLEDWDRMIDTNVKGLLFVTRALLPAMLARGIGHLVNIGSTAGYQVYPKGNVYNASKFAVRALTAIRASCTRSFLRSDSTETRRRRSPCTGDSTR